MCPSMLRPCLFSEIHDKFNNKSNRATVSQLINQAQVSSNAPAMSKEKWFRERKASPKPKEKIKNNRMPYPPSFQSLEDYPIVQEKEPSNIKSTIITASPKFIPLLHQALIKTPETIYKIKRVIGTGYCGDVKLAKDMKSKQYVALKSIFKQQGNPEKTYKRYSREIRALKLLRHPHIVQLYDILETQDEYILIMEYVNGGELFHHVASRGRLKEKEARKIFRQLLSAISYCHDNFVAHRDLKPENVLLDKNGNIKFAPNHYLTTFCGSPNYAAPEIIRGIQYEGPQVDVWSLGVLLYVCLCGHLPFKGKDVQATYQNVLQCCVSYPSTLSPEAVLLLKSIFKTDYKQRVTLSDLMLSPWVNIDCKTPLMPCALPRGPIQVVDAGIIEQLMSFGYTQQECFRQLKYGHNNPIRATYYLLLELREYHQQTEGSCSTFLSRSLSCNKISSFKSLTHNEGKIQSIVKPSKYSFTMLTSSESTLSLGVVMIKEASPYPIKTSKRKEAKSKSKKHQLVYLLHRLGLL
jgi:serine/threonine protein kinase